MVASKLSQKDRRVRSLLSDGKCVNEVARLTRIPESTVRSIAGKLCRLNQLRKVPNSYPVMYCDPHTYRENVPNTSPLGDGTSKTVLNAIYVQNKRTPSDDDGKLRFHLKGFIRATILHAGDMDTIRDNSGYVTVDWKDATYPKGRIDHNGILCAFGGLLNFSYRVGNKGSETLALWPGDILLDGAQVNDGPDLLIDRAKYLIEQMRSHGWRISEPEVRGSYHYAVLNHKLSELYSNVIESEDAEVTIDTSDELDELETFTPAAHDLMNHLPTRFFAVEGQTDSNTESIEKQDVELITLKSEIRNLTREVYEGQKSALEIIRTEQQIREMRETERLLYESEGLRPDRVKTRMVGYQ